MTREIAVVLVSGGLDSAVSAAVAAASHELAFLHLNYGQRTERRELQAFHDLADHFRVTRRLIVDMAHLKQIGGSSLTDEGLPVEQADLARTGVPTSYVPFRNAQILAIAVSWGEVIGAKKVFIGAVEEDSSGYPDCRAEFFEAFNRVITLGTKPGSGLEIVTPVIALKKHEIVREGDRLGVPFHLTWSCYQNEEKACGVCDSCALRLRGFQKAGLPDPIPYETQPRYK